MYASRFEMPEENRPTSKGALASKMIDNASSLKIHLCKSDDGKCYMDFTLEGSFGDSDNDDGFPKVDSDEASNSARDLLAAFLGRE